MALMDKSFFDELYRREKKHWWFDCRRRLAAQALHQYDVRRPGCILDMGCGTGAILDGLRRFGTEFGLDGTNLLQESWPSTAGARRGRRLAVAWGGV
jgi:SAM-dependent methyltransferase